MKKTFQIIVTIVSEINPYYAKDMTEKEMQEDFNYLQAELQTRIKSELNEFMAADAQVKKISTSIK